MYTLKCLIKQRYGPIFFSISFFNRDYFGINIVFVPLLLAVFCYEGTSYGVFRKEHNPSTSFLNKDFL